MRVFSGIQPTGELHIGTYAGAISQWLQLQNDSSNEGFFCIVDLHALTTASVSEEISKNTVDIARGYLAFGLGENERFPFFVQSNISAHTELMWILATLTGMGELERMTQYKENSGNGRARAGLFMYPVLMASDVLLYDAEMVPVGEDQVQHIELARDLAKRFNHRYGETFVVPKAKLQKQGARIMSLQDPTKKMSKSLGPAHYIGIFEPEKNIRKKFKSAVTDSGSEIVYNPAKKPGISNLFTILSVVTDRPISELERELKNISYAAFKERVADAYLSFFQSIREREQELRGDSTNALVLTTLIKGAERAQEIASKTLRDVHKKIGLIRPSH